jgi:hypothetical protein
MPPKPVERDPLVVEQPYRAPIPLQPDPYLVAWADYRWRRRVVFALYALWIPAAGMVLVMALAGAISFAAAFVYLFASVLATVYAGRFECPHCHGRFAPRRSRPGACRQCGVLVGAPKSAVLAAEKWAQPG